MFGKGCHAGTYILEELKRERIPADFQHIPGETRTNFTVVDTERNIVTRILEEGPAVRRQDLRAFKKRYSYLLNSYQYVVFFGSCLCGLKTDFLQGLIREAHRKNLKTFLDSSGRTLSEGLKAGPYCVKPNQKEAEQILGRKIRSLKDLKAVVSRMHQQGITIVLLSLGAEGLLGSNVEECWQVTPPRVKAETTVGCGDALLAGFIYAEIQGYEFREQLCHAVAAGTAAAVNRRPGVLNKTCMAEITKKVKIYRQ